MDDASSLPGPPVDTRLDEAWHQHRRRVLDIAYRMLGSVTDAEDVVQEAYVRLMRASVDEIDDIRAWLITVTGRLCLDRLRSAGARRTAYVGPWLPEPLVDTPSAGPDPADRVTLDESVRMALLVVLEQLSPAERTAFVLHDVFQVPFEEVAGIVGRTPAACRQLASRARRRMRSETGSARFAVDASEQRRVAERFASACATGDFDALLDVLDPDVVGEFDSGGALPGAPLQAVAGASAMVDQVRRFARPHVAFTVAPVNGEPGVVVSRGERILSVLSLRVRDGRIDHVLGVGNPAKLSHLRRAPR